MLETLDHDHSIYTTNKADDTLLVKFFIDTVQDMDETKKAGRPIFKEVEFVDIRIPGNKENVVVRPARQKDRDRFPRHYQLFKARVAGAKEEMVGTPLSLWPEVTAAQIKEFEYFNVRTVEQLAGIPDSTAGKFSGVQVLKQKAADYLASAQKKAPLAKMRSEIDNLTAQVQKLQENNDRLSAVNDSLRKKLDAKD